MITPESSTRIVRDCIARSRQTARSRERKSGKRAPQPAYASAQPMRDVQRTSCACGGCPRWRQKHSLQAKLEVSHPGDVLVLLGAIKDYWCTAQGRNHMRDLYLKHNLNPRGSGKPLKAFATRCQLRVGTAEP